MEQKSPSLPPSSTRKRRKSTKFRKLSILSVKSLLSNGRPPEFESSPKPNVFQQILSFCPGLKKPKVNENGRILMINGNDTNTQSENHFQNLVDIGKSNS